MRNNLSIDLNADLGEYTGLDGAARDALVMDVVTSANIACGVHAGDLDVMKRSVDLAARRGVAIGAHPSFPDREGFGRREMNVLPAELEDVIVSQIEALSACCVAAGVGLRYVKPHGALYNRAVWDTRVAEAIIDAMRKVKPGLSLLGLPSSEMSKAAERAGIQFAGEAFVDRAYRKDGTLVPRSEANAVIHDVQSAVQRAVMLVRMRSISAQDGSEIKINAQSLCVHGDNPDSEAMLRSLRSRLESAGVTIAPFAA